ncbi:MAG: NFACT RNA binding domain-containing protein [Chlorobium sp.]|nr:MAG: DUF814 domain-containing protein [Chlorobium sp.]
MIRNYFTLYHAAMELHERLRGGDVAEIYSQDKNELRLSFIDVEGRQLQIVVVTHTPLLSFSIREGVSKKARDSASLMTQVYDKKVSGVEISPHDREIRIALADDVTIVMQMFSSKTNVFLVRKNLIIDAFKQKHSLIGQPYKCGSDAPGVLSELEKLAMNQTLFLEQFNSRDKGSIAEKIQAMLPFFDRSIVKEMLTMPTDEKSPEALFIAFQSVFYELIDPKGGVREKESGEPVFSLLHSARKETRFFDSVLDGLSYYSIKMWQFVETQEELKTVQKKLKRELEKKQKGVDGFKPEMLEGFARNYETSGHLLMASLYQPRTERASITVQNIFEPGVPDTTIRLKEALTLQKNAEEYFSKASKTRGKLKVMQERLTGLKQDKKALEELLAATETITTLKEARRFIEEHSDLLGKTGALGLKNNRSPLPFRIVQLSRSASLLVGKNAANNDLLTFTHARPNDIWLHARGSAGSHCVLKGATLQDLNKIKKAAEIAAWYSAAKHSELVPVLYTLKKYVRRGKNLPAGQVIVEREEVVIVRPSKTGSPDA